MNVLVIGSGSREHAIAWKLTQGLQVEHLYVAPGNAGTASIATNLPISTTDLGKLIETVKQHRIDLTIVGPETPLAEGIVDRFQVASLAIFGPTQCAAEIESSKLFANELMLRHGIPTARSEAFDAVAPALAYLRKQPLPVVVKADGLAAGKGVVVASTYDEAEAMVRACLEERRFGASGDIILIVECLQGREVSVFAFSDGETLSPMVAACDYKRAFDGDRGPNTGGMGSYSPPEFWDAALEEQIRTRIMEPTVRALADDGHPYQGVLYGGLMLTRDGPQVIEFNCRLGDPETQVILPRLRTDLLEVTQAVVEGRLRHVTLKWNDDAYVGVAIASGGYPDVYQRGLEITGLDNLDRDVLVFHAGTKLTEDNRILTDGGRVLTVVGTGRTLREARDRAYASIAHVQFRDSFYRRDIADIAVGR